MQCNVIFLFIVPTPLAVFTFSVLRMHKITFSIYEGVYNTCNTFIESNNRFQQNFYFLILFQWPVITSRLTLPSLSYDLDKIT